MPVGGTPGGNVKSVLGMLVFRYSGEVGSAIWSANAAGGLKLSVYRGFQCLETASGPCVSEISGGE